MMHKGHYLRSWQVWVFSFLCLALNLALGYVAKLLDWPLFLINIGTVLTGALCGAIPGLIVGGLSLLTYIPFMKDILYYVLISVLIGTMSPFLSKRRVFLHWYGFLLAYVGYTLILAVIMSTMDFFFYQNQFQNITTDAWATSLYQQGQSAYSADFLASLFVFLLDDAITFLVLLFATHFLPVFLQDSLPLGYLYGQKDKTPIKPAKVKVPFSSWFLSIRTQTIGISIVLNILFAFTFSAIAYSVYQQKCYSDALLIANDYSYACAHDVTGDEVSSYMADPTMETWSEETKKSYEEMVFRLGRVYKDANQSTKQITYIYIYVIQDDKTYVIYDLPVSEVDYRSHALGDTLGFDSALSASDITDLKAGKKISGMISRTSRGWLATAYTPVLDSSGKTVAYGCVDVSMNPIFDLTITAYIQMSSLIIVALIAIIDVTSYFTETRVVTPIHYLVNQSEDFRRVGPREWLLSPEWKSHPVPETKNEILNLSQEIDATQVQICQDYQRNDDQAASLLKLQRNVIYGFAELVEKRDKQTGDHIKRTADYVRIIASELRKNPRYRKVLTDDYIDRIVLASPLHDIGKIAVPDEILLKKGKLTPEEFAIIKRHTTEGRDVIASAMKGVSEVSYLKDAEDIAYTHHEWYDGTGYPQGLKGDEIPLSGRIMAVADVFDALRSVRYYKEPFTFEQACDLIQSESGTHFDPDVVEAFLAAGKEIRIASEKSA
jgi:response regulator RpfG family c-di-GMP phosphodiesterase